MTTTGHTFQFGCDILTLTIFEPASAHNVAAVDTTHNLNLTLERKQRLRPTMSTRHNAPPIAPRCRHIKPQFSGIT